MGMKGWKSATSYNQEEKWEDNVRWGDFANKFKSFRPVGGIWPVARHWIEAKSGKFFPMWCPKYNADTEEFEEGRDCAAHDAGLRATRMALGNFIDRELQQKGDTNPIVVLSLPTTVMQAISGIIDLIGVDPADPVNGVDLYFKYDASQSGTDKYSVQRGDKCTLTTEEAAYDLFPLDEIYQPAKNADIKEALRRHGYYENVEPASTTESVPISTDLGSPPPPAPVKPVTQVKAPSPPVAVSGELPECFKQYNGTQRCLRCPVKHDCIDSTDDDD